MFEFDQNIVDSLKEVDANSAQTAKEIQALSETSTSLEKTADGLEVAAAGGHNMIMIGPPGTGKTMLAERLPGILPPMTEAQALEAATVAYIIGQGFDPTKWKQRPIRNPHHTASGVALVGGGSQPRPGEIDPSPPPSACRAYPGRRPGSQPISRGCSACSGGTPR